MKIRTINIKDSNNNYSYSIKIGKNFLNNDKQNLIDIENKKVFLILDNFFLKNKVSNEMFLMIKNVISNLSSQLHIIPIEGRDINKNFKTIETIINDILDQKIDRASVIIAFGGGVIGDITGFVASIILRGVEFIQIPTTLLAQVDSSVGGKTGINTNQGKNLVGSFYQPLKVLIDTSILKTLPERELCAGFAEVIKYSLIYDEGFFQFLNENYLNILSLKEPFLTDTIHKSCSIKAKIVSKDEKEKNLRAILNLGHTFAHALESILKYETKIIHGEAVSIGINMAFRFSLELKLCNSETIGMVAELFKKFRLPTNLSLFKINPKEMLKKLYSDKKVKNGQITFILCDKIGNAIIKNNIKEDIVLDFLVRETRD